MKKENKRGISLIVLVITILVMIILAAAVIITLNNANIINKANQAASDTDKATEKEAFQLVVTASLTTNGVVDFTYLDSHLPTGVTGTNGTYTGTYLDYTVANTGKVTVKEKSSGAQSGFSFPYVFNGDTTGLTNLGDAMYKLSSTPITMNQDKVYRLIWTNTNSTTETYYAGNGEAAGLPEGMWGVAGYFLVLANDFNAEGVTMGKGIYVRLNSEDGTVSRIDEITPSKTFTWDGNTTGLETKVISSTTLYKVSSEYISSSANNDFLAYFNDEHGDTCDSRDNTDMTTTETGYYTIDGQGGFLIDTTGTYFTSNMRKLQVVSK